MSIYSKIRIIFLVSVLFVTAFFGASFYIQKGEHLREMQKRYVQTSRFIHKHYRQSKREHKEPNFDLFLQESSFEPVVNEEKVRKIRKKAHLIRKNRVLRSKFKILRIKVIKPFASISTLFIVLNIEYEYSNYLLMFQQ